MTDTAACQRVDQWLWHTRLIKTRSMATRLVESGALRINRAKVTKPGYQVKPGDILTFMHAEHLHVIEVVTLAKRRGPASEARLLYQSALQTGCKQSTHFEQKGDA